MYQYYINVQEYLIESSKRYPDHCALVVGEKRLNYRELNNQTSHLAEILIAQGLQSGDRVVIALNNILQNVLSFWAVLKAGGVACLINDALNLDKIKEIVTDCQAKIFIGNQVFHSPQTICFDSSDFDILKNHSETYFNRPSLDIDLAAIIYTSGSTGRAKGVMMTHRNILSASTSINQYLQHNAKDIILSALPLSFDYGLYQLIMSCSVGATLILEKSFLLPLDFMKKIITEKVTVLPVVPTMITLLDDYAKKFGMQKNVVRCVTNTGAALHSSHGVGLKKLFPQSEIISMYGVTECKRCSYLPAEDYDRKPGSIGIAIPNTQLWIVDEWGKPLPPNQIGEIVIRGATVMQGYWNNPISTAKRLKAGLLPGEKILYSGDYGWLDEEGYLYFHGRMDEIFKSRGIKIVPKKIEDALLALEAIKEAVVVGVEDQAYGHAIIAFITLHLNKNAQEVKQKIKQQLLTVEQPQKIIILPALPKTAHGKYDRIKLKQMTHLEAA